MLAIVNQHTALWHANPELHLRRLIIYRWFAENFLIFLLQYTGLTFTTLSTPLSLIWFASGTSFTLLLLRGNIILPGMLLGNFLAFFLAPTSFLSACQYALLFTLQPILLRFLCYRWTSPTLLFYRFSMLAKFFIFSAIISASISFLMHPAFWLQAWLANWNGILIVATTLIAWDAYFVQVTPLSFKKGWAISCCYTLLLFLTISLLFLPSSFFFYTIFALSILMIFIKLYFDWAVSMTALFLTALVLCTSFYVGISSYSFDNFAFLMTSIQITFVTLFLVVTAIGSPLHSLIKCAFLNQTIKGTYYNE